MTKEQSRATRMLHAGHNTDTGQGKPTAPPIHVATAYSYGATEELDAVFTDSSRGYVYSRFANPTTRAYEETIAVAEGAEEAIAYASGMAAIHAIFTVSARPGDKIIASQELYGASLTMLRTFVAEFGVEVEFVDVLDLDAVRQATANGASLVFAETMSNPLIRVTDITALAKIAHEAGAMLAIDNTFASPVLVNPLALGADYVVHSSTKFIGGHGDTTGGVIATSSKLAGALRAHLILTGGMSGPFDSWLALRGLRTMHLRVREQSLNAAKIAAWMTHDPRIESVNYPGLDADNIPFNGDLRGALLSFEIKGATRETIFRFFNNLQLCTPAPTLGDVYSLVLYPTMSSHRGLTPEQRAEIGIRDNLVRLSVGIEDVEDIKADIDQALTAALGNS